MKPLPLPELQPVVTESPEERERRKAHDFIISQGWNAEMEQPDHSGPVLH